MHQTARIFVAGHRGLVGSALVRRLEAAGYRNLLLRTRQELDLRDPEATYRFFAEERPEYVFLAAAKVGGIQANHTRPADFLMDNLNIQSSVIQAATRTRVQKLLFLGSSCIYPRCCPQPIKEEYLLTGALEQTNEPYAIAKIAGLKLCESSNRQYGTNYLTVMPTNLYGPGDNYDLETSHVLPALIRKMHEAKLHASPQVTVWGTGTPRREFLYSDDLADACLFLMQRYDARQLAGPVNIGVGSDLSIRELAQQVARVVGYRGELRFDPTKPDGTPRKLLDVTRLTELGWQARTDLATGLGLTYRSFLASTAVSA